MKILGPESLVFGVDDLDACFKYLTDYGLKKTDSAPSGATFEALDGTCAVVRKASDPGLSATFVEESLRPESHYTNYLQTQPAADFPPRGDGRIVPWLLSGAAADR